MDLPATIVWHAKKIINLLIRMALVNVRLGITPETIMNVTNAFQTVLVAIHPINTIVLDVIQTMNIKL
jgi:hypothetical protein